MSLSSRLRTGSLLVFGTLLVMISTSMAWAEANSSISRVSDTTTTPSSLITHLALPDSIHLYFSRVSGGTGKSFRVTNDGDLPVTLLATPMVCGDFRLDGPRVPEELLPGDHREYTVFFFPQSHYGQTCGFSIAGGTGEFGVRSIWAGGTYQVMPGSYSFGTVAVEQMEAKSILINNYSGRPLHVEPNLIGESAYFNYAGATAIDLEDGAGTSLTIRFRPLETGDFAASLDLGPELGIVSLSGSCADVLYAIRCDPPVIEIRDSVPAQPSTGSITVTNIGALAVDLEPYSIDTFLRTIWPSSLRLQPGASVDMAFTYEPVAFGRHEFKVVLAPAHGFTVNGVVLPRFDFGPDENRLALYFDTYTLLADLTITPEPQAVYAHLVLLNPSDTSGVRGWECRVKSTEGAALVGYEIVGDNINASYPPDFTVGLATPLPSASQVVLATFEFAVWDMSKEHYGLELVPTRTPSIPGLMSWAPASNVEDLTPLLPVAGDSTVARIYLGTTVALALPTPLGSLDGEAVVLSWHNYAEPDEGYHVWRRVGTGDARRLTSIPLTSNQPEIVYLDTAPGREPGQPTAYSYALVRGSLELGHSPEVILAGSEIPRSTRLLPNVPNPFNPSTRIHFEMDRGSWAKVAVYDVGGRRVRVLANESLEPGAYTRVWDGRDASGRSLPSGAYYIRLETETKVDRMKVMLLK